MRLSIFKPYTSIKDFLNRFTLLQIGSLHIRLHKIVGKDETTLFHNHPFHYLSLVLWGGYTESVITSFGVVNKSHGPLSLIWRNARISHRIDSIRGTTYTLFFAYGDLGWKATNMNPNHDDDGIYERTIQGRTLWAKKENGIWFVAHSCQVKAQNETRHTIHQVL